MPAQQRLLPSAALLALLALLAGCDDAPAEPVAYAAASPAAADRAQDEDDDDDDDDDEFRGPTVEFADLAIFLEFNSTDDDLGVQVFLDAEGWDRIIAEAPDRRTVLDFRARRQFGDLGLTELRFESAEPSPAEVLATIPAGVYQFTGHTVEDGRLVGRARLSHALPPAPVFTPEDGAVVDPNETVLRWRMIPGLAGYEVIVANEDTGESLEIELPAGATRLTVPREFMRPDTQYKAEVLSIARNGNKTITEHVFRTR